jgi:hypothetical protein
MTISVRFRYWLMFRGLGSVIRSLVCTPARWFHRGVLETRQVFLNQWLEFLVLDAGQQSLFYGADRGYMELDFVQRLRRRFQNLDAIRILAIGYNSSPCD